MGHGIVAAIKVVIRTLTADVIVCWFASVYAAFAVRVGSWFGIKSLIIVGGVDAAKDEELGYGIWLSPWRARLVRHAFRNADKILVVDPCLREEAVRLAEYDGANIGYLPTGYDTEYWKPMGLKEAGVLTVAIVRDERTLRRKGLDTLMDAARRLPEVSFTIIGITAAMKSVLSPPANVTCIEPIPREDLLPFYQRASVYCQPSRREGLPNSLCEAMSCACIPVATDVSGHPTALGDTGFLVPVGDADPLTTAISQALISKEEVGLRARARIVSLFQRQKREQELVRIIRGLCR